MKCLWILASFLVLSAAFAIDYEEYKIQNNKWGQWERSGFIVDKSLLPMNENVSDYLDDLKEIGAYSCEVKKRDIGMRSHMGPGVNVGLVAVYGIKNCVLAEE